MRFGSWAVLSAAAICVLTSCSSRLGEQQGGSGGGGSGGSPSGTGPLVVATPIGHKPTSKAGVDPVTITVRSGADVLLSGKDTQSRGSPVTDFSWTQATGDAAHVTLLYRTSNTVDFTAPTVAAATVLNFTLTAKDSSGNGASAHVAVTVVPASDTNQFLTTAVTNPTQQTFQVAVVPLNGLSNLTADVPVCITLDRTIRYTNRNGQAAAVTLKRRPSDQVDAAWLQAAGAVGGTINALGHPDVSTAVASYTNPRATFNLPSLDEDDLFALYNQPPQPQLAQQLVAADIDSASLTVTVEATPGKCGSPVTADSNNPLIVSIVNATAPLEVADPSKPPADPANLTGSAPPGTLAIGLDGLRQAVNGTSDCVTAAAGASRCTETAASAALYYQTIDPIGSAPRASQTMNAWLDANCFNSGATNFGADTHAAYTNNFDLGFGRDMYFVTCTAKNLSQASVAAGRVAGDSASIVLNYPSLESVPLKQNPIIAVAMSHNAYTANPSTALPGRVTKFFIFAPDDRDGGFYLVRSANFDHRGQKYVPGACTVCHGGSVTATNIASGDVDAAFMPWDESALLFADTDPSYTGLIVPKTGYTEADQTAALYALNQHAYATYLNSAPATQSRFAAPKALIEKWYGGGLAATPTPSNQGNYTYTDIAFKSQKFDDTGFPSAVDPAASWANENAANGDDVYHDVFAHECRSCHTQLHTSTTAATGIYPAADQFNAYTDFKSEFVGNAHSIGSLVLGESVMPLARLTADRLWVNFNGGKSAATLLANRIQADAAASGLVDGSGNAVPSGTPQVSPVFTQAPVSSPTSGTPTGPNNAVKRLYQVRVDGSSSYFVGGYSWSLCDPSGVCAANVVGPASATPAFVTSAAGTYQLSLSGTSTSGVPFGPLSYPFTVTRTNPIAPSCTYVVPVQAQPTAIALANCATQPQDASGQPNTTSFQLGDGTNTLTVSGWSPNNGYGPSSYTFSCDSSAPTCGASMSINLTVPQNNGASVLSYNLCDAPPGQLCSPGAIKVIPTAGPSAQNAVYYATLPLVAGAISGAAPLTSPTLTLSLNGGAYAGQIPIDSTPTVGPCSAVSGDASSLARSYTITPCTDSFTLAFGAAAALGPFNLGGNDTYALSLPLTQFPNCTAAGVCSGAPYSVGYTIKDTTTAATPNSASAQVQVNVVATQSFSGTVASANAGSIYSYLDTAWGCTGCHNGSQTGATSADAPYYWTDGSGTAASAYSTLNGGNCSGVSCIDTAAPASSRLYINACVGPHIGGNAEQRDTTVPIEAQRCANLLQWLTEGAQNN